jgi:hypothetical protein
VGFDKLSKSIRIASAERLIQDSSLELISDGYKGSASASHFKPDLLDDHSLTNFHEVLLTLENI